jgi:hypothetical protein
MTDRPDPVLHRYAPIPGKRESCPGSAKPIACEATAGGTWTRRPETGQWNAQVPESGCRNLEHYFGLSSVTNGIDSLSDGIAAGLKDAEL